MTLIRRDESYVLLDLSRGFKRVCVLCSALLSLRSLPGSSISQTGLLHRGLDSKRHQQHSHHLFLVRDTLLPLSAWCCVCVVVPMLRRHPGNKPVPWSVGVRGLRQFGSLCSYPPINLSLNAPFSAKRNGPRRTRADYVTRLNCPGSSCCVLYIYTMLAVMLGMYQQVYRL